MGDSLSRVYAERFLGPNELGDLTDAAAPVSAASLLKLTDQRFDDPTARIEAGIIERRLAYLPHGQIDTALLQTADADLADGLKRAPANDLAWVELAQARIGLGKSLDALTAWRMSIATGDFDPQLDLWRMEIGLQLWLILDVADRKMLDEQINYAWAVDPKEIASLAAGSPFIRNLVHNALGNASEQRDAFDKLAGYHP